MASLRTFVQTFNNANPFSSLPNPFQIFYNPTAANDDLKKFVVEDKVTPEVTRPHKNVLVRPSPLLFSYFHSLSKQLNLNINSLNQISDENKSDYSGC